MEATHLDRALSLGRRIPEPEARNVFIPLGSIDMATPTLNLDNPHPVLPRDTATSTIQDCTDPKNTSSFCEKPQSAANLTVPIALGVTIPVVGILIALFLLHRRHVRKQREEDANDRHASLDFGLGNQQRKAKNGKKGSPEPAMADIDLAEKDFRRQRGLSMDMTSPYLLPPELQNSRESLHSLSRNLHGTEDPYRPVSQYYPNENGSVRSFNRPRGENSSIYTGSSGAPSRLQESSTAELLPNASRMSRTQPPVGFVPPPRQNSLPVSNGSSPLNERGPLLPLPNGSNPVSPVEPAHLPPPNQNAQRKGLPISPRSGTPQSLGPPATQSDENRESYMGEDGAALRLSNNYLGAYIHGRDGSRNATPTPQPPVLSKSPEPIEMPAIPADRPEPVARIQLPHVNTLPASPRPPRKASLPAEQPIQARQQSPPIIEQQLQTASNQGWFEDTNDYGDGFKVTPPSPGREQADIRANRYSMDVPPEEFAHAGLGAPGFDPKRLSMGFRPLPPTAAVESDDPEIRANRIRSFYKEYFDESKPAPAGQYYEDYDANYYGGDVAYFDPDQNNFVMPYAQPITRRAMTPPPGAQRFMGQAGAPRAFHGSMNNMAGARFMPPGRPHSSASNRRGPPGPSGPPRGRPAPPPMDLNSLPTPHKLRDDSFALMNAMDFAPPTTYRERQQGRSQSPLGERRPFSPSVPSFKPLASSYDDLAQMPSPHLLRKSGTFTGLDFAPPRRIRNDGDNMSDAGSIRSNRSGVSAMQSNAIRNGAYRVSRLPNDMVFSRDDMTNVLKPSWNQRP